MKKQFAIKAIAVSKSIVSAATKKESTSILNFAEPDVCCAWTAFQGLAPKLTFSL